MLSKLIQNVLIVQVGVQLEYKRCQIDELFVIRYIKGGKLPDWLGILSLGALEPVIHASAIDSLNHLLELGLGEQVFVWEIENLKRFQDNLIVLVGKDPFRMILCRGSLREVGVQETKSK